MKTLSCLSLLVVGLGFAVGCGGAPSDDSLPGDDAANAEGTVSAQACPITGCTGDGYPITLTLSCSPNYPFIGLQITNNTSTSVPSGATITYTAKYSYHSSVTGTTSGPLASGATKNVWVSPIGSDDPVSCTATAKWYL